MWAIKCDRVLRWVFSPYFFILFFCFSLVGCVRLLLICSLLIPCISFTFFFGYRSTSKAKIHRLQTKMKTSMLKKKRMYKSFRYYKTARTVKGDAKNVNIGEQKKKEEKKTGLKNVKLST